jgi:hypothetical protein
MIRIVIAGLLVLAAAGLADDDEQRAKLEGSWQLQTEGAKEASAYVLQRSEDGMKISGTSDGKTVVDMDCKFAQECSVKDFGHKAKVTMYFNGPHLVQTETIGSRIIRRRYTVTGDGNTMELEIIPIDPDGKAETVVFKRVSTDTAKQ